MGFRRPLAIRDNSLQARGQLDEANLPFLPSQLRLLARSLIFFIHSRSTCGSESLCRSHHVWYASSMCTIKRCLGIKEILHDHDALSRRGMKTVNSRRGTTHTALDMAFFSAHLQSHARVHFDITNRISRDVCCISMKYGLYAAPSYSRIPRQMPQEEAPRPIHHGRSYYLRSLLTSATHHPYSFSIAMQPENRTPRVPISRYPLTPSERPQVESG